MSKKRTHEERVIYVDDFEDEKSVKRQLMNLAVRTTDGATEKQCWFAAKLMTEKGANTNEFSNYTTFTKSYASRLISSLMSS